MHIGFVYPPIPYKFAETPYMPLGIGYLVAVMQEQCKFVCSIELVDGQILDEEEFWRRINTLNVDVVLISATLRQMRGADRCAYIVKSNNPTTIVVGGSGPSSLIKHNPNFMKETDFDVVVIGESEDVLPILLAYLQLGLDLESIPNLAVKTEQGIFHTKRCADKPNINALPYPNREIFDSSAYLARWRKAVGLTSVHIMGSRGCPFSCVFCDKTISGRTMRFRGPENIVAEMLYLKSRYDPDDIFYFDEIFTVRKKRVLRLCDLIVKSSVDVAWSAQGRVDCVDIEMLQAMKLAGCSELYFGVESGSDSVLKYLGKGINREQIIKAFDLCHAIGIKPGAYLIVGVPGETREDILATVSLIERIEPALVNFSVLTPFPNTVLYNQTKHLIGVWEFEQWDDFGDQSVYACNFEVAPSEAMEMIQTAYLNKIKAGMQYSAYQPGISEQDGFWLNNE